ncbi:hypothetical protein CRE_25853 [Caenorhabditis remanei]|uniref:Uncharacterized protein n=1 Tax=Caenorhabditis remanei TaxID=31234 RepID=E3NDR1_CAERE|nr:hypothetical protein CRE_25853 [Caenorhabditis remanei]
METFTERISGSNLVPLIDPHFGKLLEAKPEDLSQAIDVFLNHLKRFDDHPDRQVLITYRQCALFLKEKRERDAEKEKNVNEGVRRRGMVKQLNSSE